MPSAALLPPVLLVVALLSLTAFLGGSRWRPPRPRLDTGGVRHRRFARMAARSLLYFGAVALVSLVLLGRLDALATFPVELLPARDLAIGWAGGALSLDRLGWAMLGGVAIGGIAAGLLERRGRRIGLGDVEAILPRSPGELGWGAVLAIEAGVTEELFFRLLIPLLVAMTGGDAMAGMAMGVLLFGGAHAYQGWKGVLATMLVGALFAAIYLLSASLIAVIVLHIAIDLNALVLRPVVSGRVRWRRDSGSRSD